MQYLSRMNKKALAVVWRLCCKAGDRQAPIAAASGLRHMHESP